MSAIRILIGLGTAGITSVGLCLGIVKSNKFKVWTFRKTAQTVREYTTSNPTLPMKVEIADPESNWWKEQWQTIKTSSDLDGVFSLEAKKDPMRFRDECFEKVEANKEELKKTENHKRDENLQIIWKVCLKEAK